MSCLARLVGVAVGAALIWAGVGLVEAPFDERVHYEQAEFCPDRAANEPSSNDCLRRTSGRVLQKETSMGSRYIKLRWASGAEKRYSVEGIDPDCYDDARSDSSAQMVTWRGKLMRFTVADETCHVAPQSDGMLMMAALPGWTGAGLVLACLLLPTRLFSVRPAFRFFAWMGLWGAAYFPGIRLFTGEGQSWVTVLAMFVAVLCVSGVLDPPYRGVPGPARR